jgi:general secretion pathway protein G
MKPSNRDCCSNRHAATGGFTLVEILVVLVIITVLASVVTVSIVHKPGEARVAAAKLQIKQIQTALQVYRTEQGRVPTQAQGLDALINKPVAEPIPSRYPPEGYLETRVLPKDPWDNDYIYLTPGRQGEPYEVISYGSDGEPGGDGDAADLSSSGT